MTMICPGATIGILGGGQLGRMLALAARPLGYHVQVYCPDENAPAYPVCDRVWKNAYDDSDSLAEFAKSVDVVTFEFENVPAAAGARLKEFTRVHPDPAILDICQDRLREKEFLSRNGFPVAPYRAIDDSQPLWPESPQADGVDAVPLPGVLKTRRFGYDGKGQSRIDQPSELQAAWEAVGRTPSLLEAFVAFESEASVIVARNGQGQTQSFPVFENRHSERHILDATLIPAQLPQATQDRAREIATGIADAVSLVGLLTVELFITAGGEVLVNELAPRVHNSGHLTIEACHTSQFEQQIRAACQLPLGNSEALKPAAMVNLLGDGWAERPPDWSAVWRHPTAKLHLYGKAEPRAGRKMGHITVLADSRETAIQTALKARDEALNSGPTPQPAEAVGESEGEGEGDGPTPRHSQADLANSNG